MNKMDTERRRHPRTDSKLPLKISKKGVDVITETRNISCSGVHCRIKQQLPLMSRIGVILLIPMRKRGKMATEKVKCSGVVVRSEPIILEKADIPCQDIAIFFTDISVKDKNRIGMYVQQSYESSMG